MSIAKRYPADRSSRVQLADLELGEDDFRVQDCELEVRKSAPVTNSA